MANQDIFGLKKEKKHGPHGVLVTPVVPPAKDEEEAPETSNKPSDNRPLPGPTPHVGGMTTEEETIRDEWGNKKSVKRKRTPFGI